MDSERKEPLDVVSLVLVGIFFACVIFTGSITKKIPADAAGLALLSWVALVHMIGLIYSVCKEETEAAVIIFIFTGFWVFLGLGLIALPTESSHALLLWVEPALIMVILFWQSLYKGETALRAILWGLLWIISWLFASKFMPCLEVVTPIWVMLLGVWALCLARQRR